MDKYEIAKIEGHEDDLLKVNIDSVAFQKLDMNLLLYNHSVSCGHFGVHLAYPRHDGFLPLLFGQHHTGEKQSAVEPTERGIRSRFPGIFSAATRLIHSCSRAARNRGKPAFPNSPLLQAAALSGNYAGPTAW